MKDIAFYTFFSDYFFFAKRAWVSVNSFVKFHPDIDVFVYREDYIKNFFQDNNPLAFTKEHTGEKREAWYNLTTSIALDLSKEYKRVVHFDGDVISTGRWDEVLKDDWEIGAVMNHNVYENTSIENITEEMYIQNGIAGSSSKKFWYAWQKKNIDASKNKFYDCDNLNLLIYNDPTISKMKIKIFDKEKDYYGCKSLGREQDMYLQDNELMLDGQKVKAYHWARGSNVDKFKFETLPFKRDVIEWLYDIGNAGKSVMIKGL